MMSLKSVSIACLVALLSFAGCSKKEPAGDPSAATKPAEPAAAAAVTVSTDDDYVSQSSSMLDKMTGAVKAGGTDCDKVADSITKLATENHATLQSLQAYEKAHPEAKKKFDAASKDKMKAFEDAAGPVMGACQSNKKLSDAFEKLAPG